MWNWLLHLSSGLFPVCKGPAEPTASVCGKRNAACPRPTLPALVSSQVLCSPNGDVRAYSSCGDLCPQQSRNVYQDNPSLFSDYFCCCCSCLVTGFIKDHYFAQTFIQYSLDLLLNHQNSCVSIFTKRSAPSFPKGLSTCAVAL